MIEIKNRHKEREIIEKPRPKISELKETNFSLRHNTVKERVKSLLRSDKYSRQNDFYLCLLYWVKMGFITTHIELKDFSKITKPESISRCRRELLKDAKQGDKDLQFLLNDNETLNKRQDLELLNHDYYQKQKSSWMAGWIK